jgi:hypothetical protein
MSIRILFHLNPSSYLARWKVSGLPWTAWYDPYGVIDQYLYLEYECGVPTRVEYAKIVRVREHWKTSDQNSS